VEYRELHPDDEVYNWRAIWLGPKGMTLPVEASNVAWGFGFCMFLAIVMFKRIVGLDVGTPPGWEAAWAAIITGIIMAAVDYDKPVRAVILTTLVVYTTRYRKATKPITATPTLPMLKITRDPLNVDVD
jgi:hypothetical protein